MELDTLEQQKQNFWSQQLCKFQSGGGGGGGCHSNLVNSWGEWPSWTRGTWTTTLDQCPWTGGISVQAMPLDCKDMCPVCWWTQSICSLWWKTWQVLGSSSWNTEWPDGHSGRRDLWQDANPLSSSAPGRDAWRNPWFLDWTLAWLPSWTRGCPLPPASPGAYSWCWSKWASGSVEDVMPNPAWPHPQLCVTHGNRLAVSATVGQRLPGEPPPISLHWRPEGAEPLAEDLVALEWPLSCLLFPYPLPWPCCYGSYCWCWCLPVEEDFPKNCWLPLPLEPAWTWDTPPLF